MENIYTRISALTNQRGLTGKELGHLLNLSKSPLTDWKNEKSKPTLDQLQKLCEIFAVSADYLLFGIEPTGLSSYESNLLMKFRMLNSTETKEALRYIDYILDHKEPENKQDAFPQGQPSSTSESGKKTTAASEETA